MASQYVVTSDAAVNLAAHLNHRVRIVGTTMMGDHMTSLSHRAHAAQKPTDPMAKPEGAMAKPGMGKDMSAMSQDWSTLHATGVTMISATCPAVSQ